MTPIGQAFGYLSGALVIVIMMLSATAYKYRAELAEAVTTNVECQMNNSSLLDAIATQNDMIKAVEIDRDARIAAIKPITKTVVKERLKVVYVDHNVSQGECNEVLSTIDAIRNTGF